MNGIARIAIIFAFLGTSLTAPTCAVAHPFYASIAEMEWNAESGCLEVAVRLDPEDLEAALRNVFRRRIVLEKEERLDALLVAYAKKTFRIRPRLQERGPRREVAPLKWVGHELTPRFVWIYFEVPLPAGTIALEVNQSMLVETVPLQVNTVSMRHGRRFLSVNCTADRAEQTIALPAALRITQTSSK